MAHSEICLYSESNESCILCDISGYFELSGFELLRFYCITTSKKVNEEYKIALLQIIFCFILIVLN